MKSVLLSKQRHATALAQTEMQSKFLCTLVLLHILTFLGCSLKLYDLARTKYFLLKQKAHKNKPQETDFRTERLHVSGHY